jgi:N-ethylmaleimide reductase
VVDDFVKAAANAIEAGFDGVELHGANGYPKPASVNLTAAEDVDGKAGRESEQIETGDISS